MYLEAPGTSRSIDDDPTIRRECVAPGRSGAHYVWVGRIGATVLVAMSIGYAVFLDSVVTGLQTFWVVQALMGIPFWMGIFWRRATVAGAWASTLVAFFVALLTGNAFAAVFDVNAFAVANLPAWTVHDGSLRLPVQMLAYLSCGFLTMVVVSLLTRPVERARLDKLFRALQTPVDHVEPTPPAPFEVPEGSVPRPGRKIIDHPDFELRYPGFVGGAGFAFAWVWVLALIGGVYWLSTA